jgi:hypothetical protein
MKTYTIRVARTYKMYATVEVQATSESLAYEMAEDAVDNDDNLFFEVDYYDEAPATYDIVDEVDTPA